jgi:hypothetical protein
VQSSHADSKARPFGMNCFSAGLKSSSPLLKQGAPTNLGVERFVASFSVLTQAL